MFKFFIIKSIVILLFSLISIITDIKDGYIYDFITIPLIILGFIISIIEKRFITSLIIFVVVFGVFLLLYKKGSRGGGDVKLLSGISLFYGNYLQIPTIVFVLFFASISAFLFYGSYYCFYFIFKKFIKYQWKILTSIIISLIFTIFFYSIILKSLLFFIIMLYVNFISVLILFINKDIESIFYKKNIDIQFLKEDDTVEINNKRIQLTKNSYNKIKTKFDKIIVLRNLPIFAPFIFIGVLITIVLIFLKINMSRI